MWCLTRVLLPTPSGRQRFNVLSSLHAVVTVTNDTSLNSESVVTLLQKLAGQFTTRTITMVVDHAR